MRKPFFQTQPDEARTDFNTSPRTWPCFDCGRDVRYNSERCICVPSQDRSVKIGPTLEADRLIILSPEQ